MSADGWIKLRTKLPRDGRLRVASRVCHALGVTEYRTTVTLMLGAIATLWCLADEHADADGVLTGYTADAIDAEVGVPGFCEALPSEWIDLSGQWVKLPEYQEHNGTTGKSRAQATKRKRKERAVTNVADSSRHERDTSVTREEKRREDSPVGNSSTSAKISKGADAASALGDEQARTVVLACKALRKMGIGAQPAHPALLDLAARGATVEQMALTASELALRKVGWLGDTDRHPELLELFASGATPAQMGLSQPDHATLCSAAPNLNYLAKTLIGRAADGSITLGDHDGHANAGRRAGADHGGAAGSAAGRAEEARRAGDARDDLDDSESEPA